MTILESAALSAASSLRASAKIPENFIRLRPRIHLRTLHDYDATLKKIITRAGSLLLRTLTGSDSVEWLNVELHRRRSLRVDLLGRLPDGRLIHIELQSRNEKLFWARMGEYGFTVAREYGQYPVQIVLYVGQEPLRLESEVPLPHFVFRFPVLDIRNLETEALLASENPSDNVIAILTRDGATKDVIRRVLAKVAAAKPAERKEALAELSMIAGLRRLGNVIGSEVSQMPILEDIYDHDLFGPKMREARAEGLEEGLQRGLEKGREEGQVALLLKLAEQRFGAIPAAMRGRIRTLQPAELERAVHRLLSAHSIEDLIP